MPALAKTFDEKFGWRAQRRHTAKVRQKIQAYENVVSLGNICSRIIFSICRVAGLVSRGLVVLMMEWGEGPAGMSVQLIARVDKRRPSENEIIPRLKPCAGVIDFQCESKSSRSTSTLPLGTTTGRLDITSRQLSPFRWSASIRSNLSDRFRWWRGPLHAHCEANGEHCTFEVGEVPTS